MPETKFERDTQRLDCLGLDCNRPVDSVKPSKFPFLLNCRSFLAGRIEPRDGMTNLGQVVAGQFPLHSARRLNDLLAATFTRVIGIGTHLAVGQSFPYTDLDSGYSGDPLALVPWKPRDSPNSYMYVADRSRMRKVNVSGGLHTIGFPHPNTSPTVALTNVPRYKNIDTFAATTGWSQAGTAGAPSAISRTPGGAAGTNTTIGAILYDSGSTGWANVTLVNMTGVGQGEVLDFNPGGGTDETVTVQVAFPNSTTTTIGSIVYDSGSSGPCSIVFATPLPTVYCDALLNNSTRTENARIIAVTPGPDGTVSIRLSTSATWASGDAVSIQASVRVYLANNHAAAENVRIDAVRTAVTNGVGTLIKTSALDLSRLTTGVTAQPSDYMHVSFRVSDPSLISELRVQVAVDAAPPTDATTGAFTGNYYFKSFRANDITSAITGASLQSLVTNRQTVVTRGILGQPDATPQQIAAAAPPPVTDPNTGEDVYQFADYTYTNPITGVTFFQQVTTTLTDASGNPVNDNNISQQMGAGTSQWAELTFPMSELIRVGTDTTLSLANVTKIQVLAIVAGNVNVDISSWWIGGGYGPDNYNPSAAPYHYRYRAREKTTNVPSNWSPSSQYNAQSFRQSITVTPPQYAAPAGTTLSTTDFVLDIERIGGQINDWHYAGTIANVASPSFTDVYTDDFIAGQPAIGQDNYQPWPVIGAPVFGSTGQVSGTSVLDSGTSFNTSWAPGTRITINNTPFTIRRVISTSFLEILENAGAVASVSWRIDAPTLLAQPLPCLWLDEQTGVFFACGDTVNAGRLYYSNPDSETTVPTNYKDGTPPSEPLMNGVSHNIRNYVFSSDNFYQILATSNLEAIQQNIELQTAPVTYELQKIPNGKGLFSRWAMTRMPAPFICFLARDGINMTTGGSAIPLTDADLYEIFPNEGNPGISVNGVIAPVITSANATKLRLDYYDEYLYFDFLDLNGNQATLVLAFDLGAAVRGEAPGGWFYDRYTPGVVFHYGEEGQGVHSLLLGTFSSVLYQYAGNSDDGVAIGMSWSTPSRDQNDPRLNKLYGDIMLDCNLGGLTATATPFFNNNNISGPTTSLTNSTRSQLIVPLAPLASGTSWQTALNISLNVQVSVSTSVRPFFFIWEPRWTFEAAPISAISWEISPTTFGMENFKHIGICKVTHVSTVDLLLTFIVDNVVQTPITIPNSGGVYKQTIFRVPVYKGKLFKMRVASSDNATQFRLDPRDSFFEIKDWASDGAYNKLRVFGDFSLVEG